MHTLTETHIHTHNRSVLQLAQKDLLGESFLWIPSLQVKYTLLQCVAECCRVLQSVAVCCTVLQYFSPARGVLSVDLLLPGYICVGSALQCIAVCCRVVVSHSCWKSLSCASPPSRGYVYIHIYIDVCYVSLYR